MAVAPPFMSTETPVCSLPDVGTVAVRIRSQAINLLVNDEAPSYSFDLAGRLIGAFVDGVNYRRGLDNRVLCKWRSADGIRQRRWLDEAEAERFLTETYGLADRVARAIGHPRLSVLRGWDWERLTADAAHFARVYRPVSILPPDQYLALVIQATEGCSYNRCTFCDFYRDRPFRIKGADELRAHIAAVRDFFGPALGLRKSLFLADANALVAPTPRVRAWLSVIEETGIRPTGGGIYSFIDAFDVHRKTTAEWAELAAHGLRRVYIGMETGDEALLRWLRKPGTVQDVIESVRLLKAAGVAVSVIIMLGIGSRRFAEAHVANSAAALNAMPLGRGDIVYFSPFVDHPGSEYGRLAREEGIEALTEQDMAAQETAIRSLLRSFDPGQQPQFSRYDIREFIY
ncbi:MAG: radical SAM protein [Anaerolineae bacterium]|nr:radical SAM protein [Anaerolineae bacterium]